MEQLKQITYQYINRKIASYIQDNIQYNNKQHLLKILNKDEDKMWMEYAVNRDEDGDINDYLRENNYDILDTMSGRDMYHLIQYVRTELYDNYGTDLDMKDMTPDKIICQYAYCIGNFEYNLEDHIDEIDINLQTYAIYFI